MEQSRAGEYGWGVIGLYVAIFDLAARETLSSTFRRYQPYSGLLLGYTAAHLMGWLPEEYDAFKSLTRFNVKNPTDTP